MEGEELDTPGGARFPLPLLGLLPTLLVPCMRISRPLLVSSLPPVSFPPCPVHNSPASVFTYPNLSLRPLRPVTSSFMVPSDSK